IASGTFARGDAGRVEVQASDLHIEGTGTPDSLTGITSQVSQGSSGNAGSVSVIVAGLLELRNGSEISSKAFGQGDAGGVEVQVSDLHIEGTGTAKQPTGITSQVSQGSSGDAGSVSITVAGLLELHNGATIVS